MEQDIVTLPQEDLSLSGQTVVISGTLPDMSREEATQLIQSHGGKVTSSVSKKTAFLLAESLGIPVLSLSELQEKLQA